MTEVDDKTLTAFLITAFVKIFNGELLPSEQEPRPKNLRQYKHQDGDLTFLETDVGLLDSFQSDIRVMLGPPGDRYQVWGMSIVTRVDVDGLTKLGLSRSDLRMFAANARRNAFTQTLAKIKRGEPFSLFDLPDYEEPAPVGKNGHPGRLHYHENISDDLGFFGGDESIKYVPQDRFQRSTELLESYYQGGRV